MKTLIFAASLLALSTSAMAANVGVSVNIGQPGFFGQIDIGHFPQPQVIYTQPVVIQRRVQYANQAPIYLRVPPGHEKHWAKHCAQYQACGRPVYFVRDNWYRTQYVPRYRAQRIQPRRYDDGQYRGNAYYGDDGQYHDKHNDHRRDQHGHDDDHDHDRGHDRH